MESNEGSLDFVPRDVEVNLHPDKSTLSQGQPVNKANGDFNDNSSDASPTDLHTPTEAPVVNTIEVIKVKGLDESQPLLFEVLKNRQVPLMRDTFSYHPNGLSREQPSSDKPSSDLDNSPSQDLKPHVKLTAVEDNDSISGPKCGKPDQLSSETITADYIALAGENVQRMALVLDDKLDKMTIQSVVKECVRTSSMFCTYCRHSTQIAVNGKQLALHLLSQHRFIPVKNDTSDDFVRRLKGALGELELMFFNTDTYDSTDRSIHISYHEGKTFNCFQCNYVSESNKELFIHKKKVHTKLPIGLLCIMCKSNFDTYSELLCHMCPGANNSDISLPYPDPDFRCFLCHLDKIPSGFMLMVHIRKQHSTCDVCFEKFENQQRLYSHLWKHKVSHFCSLCNIIYESKSDMTTHLFWKHGKESKTCKKCLQRKWAHVYHFCVPPNKFICDECECSFSKAVALKVHKRLHTGDLPYACNKCDKKFVSRKLLEKHDAKHEMIKQAVADKVNTRCQEDPEEAINNGSISSDIFDLRKEFNEKNQKRLPVFYVNLSEGCSSSDDEVEEKEETFKEPEQMLTITATGNVVDVKSPRNNPSSNNLEDVSQKIEDDNNIWRNFLEVNPQNYLPFPLNVMNAELACKIITGDHDYSKPPGTPKTTITMGVSMSVPFEDEKEVTRSPIKGDLHQSSASVSSKQKSPKKKLVSKGHISSSSSDSSSSDSSTCGTSCSCSSSTSSSSSSSSDSDSSSTKSPSKQTTRRKQQLTSKDDSKKAMLIDPPVRESDLETDESSSDEDWFKPTKALRQPKLANPRPKAPAAPKLPLNGLHTKIPEPKAAGIPTESHLLVKRKRTRTKFYGFSGDDEYEQRPPSPPRRKRPKRDVAAFKKSYWWTTHVTIQSSGENQGFVCKRHEYSPSNSDSETD